MTCRGIGRDAQLWSRRRIGRRAGHNQNDNGRCRDDDGTDRRDQPRSQPAHGPSHVEDDQATRWPHRETRRPQGTTDLSIADNRPEPTHLPGTSEKAYGETASDIAPTRRCTSEAVEELARVHDYVVVVDASAVRQLKR